MLPDASVVDGEFTLTADCHMIVIVVVFAVVAGFVPRYLHTFNQTNINDKFDVVKTIFQIKILLHLRCERPDIFYLINQLIVFISLSNHMNSIVAVVQPLPLT